MPAWISPTGKPPRGDDKWGSGAFGAPRGGRPHYGVDYVCEPGQQVVMPCDGIPSRIKRPYHNDTTWNGLLIKAGDWEVTLFYLTPTIALGRELKQGVPIGTAQDISVRYTGITPHIHAEIRIVPGTSWHASPDRILGRDYLFRPTAGVYLNPEVEWENTQS